MPRLFEKLPSQADRDRIVQSLTDVMDAIAAHEKMQPPNRHPTLLDLWEFAHRTAYIASELGNIAASQPVKFPDQIPEYRDGGESRVLFLFSSNEPHAPHPPFAPAPSQLYFFQWPYGWDVTDQTSLHLAAPGPETARECMVDVFTRSQTLTMLVTGHPFILMAMGLEPVECGNAITEKCQAVQTCLQSIPE